MKNIKPERQAFFERYKELYHAAKEVHSEVCSELEVHMRQYLGSYEIDNSSERATTVRNVTYEVIESQIDPDIPYPKAEPEIYTEKGERCAHAIERLCRTVRERLPFESLNDLDERYTYIYGGSIWYVEWDSGIRSSGAAGGVKIHCISPLDFIPQPSICDVDCMQYCFLRFTTTKSELVLRYGVEPEEVSLSECEYRYSELGTDEDTVTVIIALYRDSDGDIGKLVFSGELLLSDLPKYYSRKAAVCKSCKKPESECGCKSFEPEYLDTPFELVGEDTHIKYYTPGTMPIVIRRNTRISDTLLGLSDCERIRPQQQAINKVESRILKKLLRAGVTPVIPEDASVTLGNSVFGEVIRMRPGESVENYGKIDTTPDISQDIAEADRLYDQAKRVLGITDALQGTDRTVQAESGLARQLKIARASSRLETKKRMKYHAYSRLYKIIFEHYLAFADEPRLLTYKDPYGLVCDESFNRHDFIETGCDGLLYYSDAYLFSVDLNSGSDYSREALWERNLANLESGTLGDVSDPHTLLCYWQSQERASYPFAKENVEYFRRLIKLREDSSEESQAISDLKHAESAAQIAEKGAAEGATERADSEQAKA
ncbi:MAG: hypothetical protein IJ459_02825 [Clostridia bacterium]|nr:hypothetical protein [Clostridia bacterium]